MLVWAIEGSNPSSSGGLLLETPVTQTGKIRVLSVDDHSLMRDGIAMALQSQTDMELVGEASNGDEAILAYRRYLPDITLMDLQMPVRNGVEAIEAIRAEWPQAKIIVLTTYSGDIQALQALKAGASGYLLKNMLRTELISTIKDVHAGKRRVSSEIAEQLAQNISADALTAREVEVLRNVAAGRSNKMVADELAISEDTVKGHMRYIMAKLNANDRTHAVLIAINRGYFTTEP